MKKLSFILLAALTSTLVIAQEGGGTDINVDINKGGGGNWYTSPWVWVIVAAVFILLLVALTRGRRD
ncbi:MAG TPA: hypothetical protein VM368_01360 [Flavisolibacter sp.]|nr:hypothetical protein [Flavisolibacter sp.]